MTHFAVTIEKIKKVWKHPDPEVERLAMATLEGRDYDFVTLKDQFKEGDLVVYFPIDSLLPEWAVEYLGLQGKLAHGQPTEDGSPRILNRVRTVRLRGQLSQGVVTDISILGNENVVSTSSGYDFLPGHNVTEVLGVGKYEPPPVSVREATLVKLHPDVPVYDIWSAQDQIAWAPHIMAQKVFVTEKIEGTHWAITRTDDGKIVVNSRNYQIDQIEGMEHDFYKIARLGGFYEAIEHLWKLVSGEIGDEVLRTVTIRGEYCGAGINQNIYKFKDQKVYAFEIEINRKPVSAAKFIDLAKEIGVATVPILGYDVTLEEWLNGQTIKDAADGESRLNSTVRREGIVIKPFEEMPAPNSGERLFLKQRSIAYLAKHDL